MQLIAFIAISLSHNKLGFIVMIHSPKLGLEIGRMQMILSRSMLNQLMAFIVMQESVHLISKIRGKVLNMCGLLQVQQKRRHIKLV